MKLKLALITLFAFQINLANAQQDPKAKAILDDLSAKTKSYSTIKADFNYTLENKAEGINETQSGTIALKGDKYALKIAGQEVISDGKTVWTYLPDAEEVQITEVDPEENEGQINPSNIFTLYESGFNYKFVSEAQSIAQINLFPTDVDEAAYHTIKLYVDKTKLQLTKIVIMGKEGDSYTYNIKGFTPNMSIPDSKFTFNTAAHPDVEVNDLR